MWHIEGKNSRYEKNINFFLENSQSRNLRASTLLLWIFWFVMFQKSAKLYPWHQKSKKNYFNVLGLFQFPGSRQIWSIWYFQKKKILENPQLKILFRFSNFFQFFVLCARFALFSQFGVYLVLFWGKTPFFPCAVHFLKIKICNRPKAFKYLLRSIFDTCHMLGTNDGHMLHNATISGILQNSLSVFGLFWDLYSEIYRFAEFVHGMYNFFQDRKKKGVYLFRGIILDDSDRCRFHKVLKHITLIHVVINFSYIFLRARRVFVSTIQNEIDKKINYLYLSALV